MCIDELHRTACEQGLDTYRDPKTDDFVFTAVALEAREACCGCGCRHCPFGHRHVESVLRTRLHRDPWIEGTLPDGPVDVLFWSGGKDSYLTLRALLRDNMYPVVLLTTFDGRSETVAHQEITLDDVRRQRDALQCAHVFVPLFPYADYMDRIRAAIHTLQRRAQIARLVFGDLHLEDVRAWREKALSTCPELSGLPLHLPLWGRAYEDLLDDLEVAPARARISAVADALCARVVSVGDDFGRDLIARLPNGVDAFGENGEFHSYVEIFDDRSP